MTRGIHDIQFLLTKNHALAEVFEVAEFRCFFVLAFVQHIGRDEPGFETVDFIFILPFPKSFEGVLRIEPSWAVELSSGAF
jgi:hypothetical protein